MTVLLSPQHPAADRAPARSLGQEIQQLRRNGRLGIDVLERKLRVLREQLRRQGESDAIQRIGSRLKSVESILGQAQRRQVPLTVDDIRQKIVDVAGVRAVCELPGDLYAVRDMLLAQPDVTLLADRDYVAYPKPSGYRSLHLVVEVPVLLDGRVDQVAVELQLRTVAMDHWARWERQLGYKKDSAAPVASRDDLRRAADVAWSLDTWLQHLHLEARGGVVATRPPLAAVALTALPGAA